MAGTTIAYGEITILDLIDTATYIYYSANEDGTGASIAPDANTKYIGIYSGPALSSRPDTPKPEWDSDVWSGWQKYVGEDGADGNGINSIIYYYLTNNSSNMPSASDITSTDMETPTSTKRFLWQKEVIKYTNGTSQTTVSLLGVYGDKGKDGADGILYDIQTNHEKIYKFFSSSDSTTFSPESISFKACKSENGKNSLMHPNSDYDTDIALAGHGDNDNFSHLWYFLNKLTGQNNQQKKNLLEVARNIQNDTVSFNFYSLFDYFVSEELDENNKAEDVADFKKFINLLKTENGCFIYKIFKHGSYEEWPTETNLLAIKPIQFEFGTSEDMAKFAVTATSINAAVENAKLEFNADGLIIKNGGLSIIGADGIDGKPTTLMEYNPISNTLNIIGNGTFSGTIYADAGYFRGNVTATTLTADTGNIGGFTIESGYLCSSDDNKSIKLSGADGKIEAEKIDLGTGARITKYIQFGNNGKAFLRNPDEADGILLEASKIKLTEGGNLQLGDISLNGETSTILGNNWHIAPDYAEFKNINVSGKISTVIFEQNHVQAVGGSMIFKPSYEVKNYNKNDDGTINTLTLDKPFSGKEGNYIYLIKEDGSIIKELISVYQIIKNSNGIIINPPIKVTQKIVSLVDIGTEDSLVIGINSNDDGTGLLKPRGFTITEFNSNNFKTDNSQNPKVFLGDLNKSGIKIADDQGLEGFGLYSENVYLTGSLTTQINNEDSESTYAGINTLNGATTTNGSKIVFWAGATGMSSIADAPFQVTDTGSLYASQGIFEGAIISKSEIRGADIYAARIHGQLDGAANSLTFYDASKGIVFKKGDWNGIGVDSSTEVFSIGEKGLQRGKDNYFIHINEKGNVKFIGDEIQASEYFTDKTKSYFLHLKDNKIYSSKMEENGQEQFYANIVLGSEEISFGLGENIKELIIDSDEIQLKKETVKMDKTVLFGEQLKYEQVSNGYNLYVL